MRTVIFGCEEDHISIRVNNNGNISRFRAVDMEQIKSVFNKLKIKQEKDVVMFSSSMDFPKEYTKSKKLLKLVEELQS
jgi:hypothetical protein